MFVINLIKKNIVKHWKKSILTVLVSMVIILFLLLYIQNIESNQEQLAKLGEIIPVTGRVCNIDGSQDIGLEIDFDRVDRLLETGFVRDEVITAQAYGMKTDASEEDRLLPPPLIIIGANTFDAFNAFSSEDITFMEGYNESFLLGEEGICILRDTYMIKQDIELGDEFELEVYIPKYMGGGGSAFSYEMMGIKKLKAIGSYVTNNRYASSDIPDILCPIDYIKQIYEGTRERPRASSMRFTISDPLRLNDFKNTAKMIGFSSVDNSGGFSHTGKALSINDQTFILSATQLKESLDMLQGLAPLIFFIVAVIGFISSYLLMQSRRNEFAIMRSLGTSKNRCFATIFLESMLLAWFGSFVGTISALVIVEVSLMMLCSILVAFLTTYLLGTAIALFLLNRFSVMNILTKTD